MSNSENIGHIVLKIKQYLMFIANLQNISHLIGQEVYNIGCIVLFVSILYSLTKTKQYSISVMEENKNLSIKNLSIINYD